MDVSNSIQQERPMGSLGKLKNYIKQCLVRLEQHRRRKAILKARQVVDASAKSVSLWRNYVEFRVFRDVEGDEIRPDTVHGQSLTIHFSEKVLLEDFDGDTHWAQLALCTDNLNRCFELQGIPGVYADLRRINSEKGFELLAKHTEMVKLANSELP